jgi:hypothetical protein
MKVQIPIQKFVMSPKSKSPVKSEEPKPVHSPAYKNNRQYKYCVYPGNYPANLRKVMNDRGNWQEVDQETAIDVAHFIFRPVNFGQPVSPPKSFKLYFLGIWET